MAITGSQPAITPARSGLMRSGAGRAGWPISVGRKVLLYALSNIARSDATRSNYVGPASFITIGGIQIGTGGVPGTGKVVGNMTITDVLNQTPNRCAFRVRGMVPKVGQDVIVSVGSKNSNERLFAGQILNTSHVYVGSPANYAVDVNAIDWTHGLNQRLVSQRWQAVSATTIATDIIAAGSPGYSTTYVAAGLPVLNEFTVTDLDVTQALTALSKRIGGYWYVDEFKVVHLFVGDDPAPATPPTILNAIHPTLTDLQIDRDGSQLVTRVYVEGGGSVAATELPPGHTMLPLVTASWYEPSGGQVKSGPQRIRYTGVSLGGGGTLVGPGASPAAAPAGLVVGGAGMTAGAHDWAVSFVTASGESLAGPRLTLTVGAIASPLTAPTFGGTQAGVGPDAGLHYWAVTFVTATGETTIGPAVSATVPEGPIPSGAPVPGTPTFAGSMEPGSYAYAATFVTASGESTPGPISGYVTMLVQVVASPSTSPVPGATTTGGSIEPGSYAYSATFVSAVGESTPGPLSGYAVMVPMPIAYPSTAPVPGTPIGGGSIEPGTFTWSCAFVTAAGESRGGPNGAYATTSAVGPTNAVPLTGIPIGPAGTIRRRIYRMQSSGPEPRFVADINDNSTTTYLDTSPTTLLGGPPPPIGFDPYSSVIPLTNIPTGPSGTTARRLYRTKSGGTAQLLAQLNNNSTTSYTDTSATASLGGPPPVTGASTTTTAVPLSDIPRGPTGVTKRRIYRTKSGGTSQFLVELANNTTTTYTDTTATASLGGPPPTVNLAGAAQVVLNALPLGGPDVTARKVYRTKAETATPFQLAVTVNDNTTTATVDTVTDAALGAVPPVVSTALANRVQLSGIPIGAAAVTSRKLYRSAAGVTPLKLLTTLADNATTTYLDAIADASLGAAPPASDLSGLTQPAGNVPAGSTSIIVAGASAFLSTGGWAVIGNGQQVVRYTGISGNAIVGIPASGSGAIVASIAYNSTITASPMLTGIPASGDGAIVYALKKGDDVNLWIQVDDAAAQTLAAALFTSAAGGVHSGIIEEIIQDRRLSAVEARARGLAHLAERRELAIRVRYKSRDMNTRSGRLITIYLPADPYNLSATFIIQSVTIRDFTPSILPTFDVEASSTRFSFEDLLRRISIKADVKEG
jgi:hypothetical protein